MDMLQDTIWQQFLQPVFGLLVDEKALRKLSSSINWKQECDRFTNPDLTYPDYYRAQNFHGVKGGYLTSDAAISYDAVTQYVLPPNETWNREAIIKAVEGNPQRILDLGCGTASTTILLKQAFPNAKVVGLDLSPYMLAVASHKIQKIGYDIELLQAMAESTGFSDDSFDLVTASLLFHETPTDITQAIIRECFRILVPGGQVVIFDGNQKTLRNTSWLTNIFEEPYIKDYAEGSIDAWLGATGFDRIHTEDVWLTNQVTYGLKPLPIKTKKPVFNGSLELAIS